MRNGAEPSFLLGTGGVPQPPALRVMPTDDDESAARRDALIRRLAADRIRELRDDGLTLGYLARMYDTEPALLEQLFAELPRSR
jgi:hypothetical protein